MRKAIVLQTNMRIKIVDFKEGLKFFYENIDCDCIDIVRPCALENLGIKYKQPRFIIVVDDEGLLKDGFKFNPFGTLLYGSGLAGHVMICKEVETEDGLMTEGLNKRDIEIFNDGMLELIDKLNLKK